MVWLLQSTPKRNIIILTIICKKWCTRKRYWKVYLVCDWKVISWYKGMGNLYSIFWKTQHPLLCEYLWISHHRVFQWETSYARYTRWFYWGWQWGNVCISERNVRFEVAELINLPFEEKTVIFYNNKKTIIIHQFKYKVKKSINRRGEK